MRVAQILFSYAMAALTGSFALAMISFLIGDASAGHILGSTVALALGGMFAASVIALPVLAVSEVQKLDKWQFYAGTCAIAAPAVYWAVHPAIFESNLVLWPMVACGGALSGVVYWWIAWRVFEPINWRSGDL